MEEFIHKKNKSCFCKDKRVETWGNLDALHAAIDSGDVPARKITNFGAIRHLSFGL
jgi:hypothetical protein